MGRTARSAKSDNESAAMRLAVRAAGAMAIIGAGFALTFWFKPHRVDGLVILGDSEVQINAENRTKPLHHVFMIRNASTVPVRVHGIHCGCTCMATKFRSDGIAPGQTVPFEVTITRLDAYKLSYHEKVELISDSGSLNFGIYGSLPRPETVLFRPRVVYMDVSPGIDTVEREVIIRIPRQFTRQFATSDLRIWNAPQLKAELITDSPTEAYFEFRIALSQAAQTCSGQNGRLVLDTDCGVVDVEIQYPPGN